MPIRPPKKLSPFVLIVRLTMGSHQQEGSGYVLVAYSGGRAVRIGSGRKPTAQARNGGRLYQFLGCGLLVVISVTAMNAGAVPAPSIAGDIDGSGSLNALDVQLVVNALLGIPIDSDGDGLCNTYEIRLGTDPRNVDTDGDGLNDWIEVYSGGDPLNPISPDGGVLQVTIEPPAAISTGARWALDRGQWQTSGTQVSVVAGMHEVSFSDIEGWITPDPISVMVDIGQVLSIPGAYMPAPTSWSATYGRFDDDYIRSILPLSDGNYMLMGYAYIDPRGQGGFFTKINQYGQRLWTKFPPQVGGYPSASDVTLDGGFGVIFNERTSDGWNNVRLLRYGHDGEFLWDEVMQVDKGHSYYAIGLSAAQDGGFAMVGNFSGLDSTLRLTKSDPWWERVWSQDYGIQGDQYAYSLVGTSDGGFAVAGQAGSPSRGMLVKFDSVGNRIFDKSFGSLALRELQETSDAGFVLVGGANGATEDETDIFVAKTDADGNMEWAKTFGGTDNDYGVAVCVCEDGTYAVAGHSYPGTGGGDCVLIKVDELGNELWRKTFGGPFEEEVNDIVQTKDEGYLLAGTTKSFGSGHRDIFVVKTDAHGIAPATPAVWPLE